MNGEVRILRISTVPLSLNLLLKGQLGYMVSKGLDVSVACSYGPEIEELKAREQVSYYPIPLTRKFNVFKDIVALFYLIKLIKKIKPHIVHSHSPKAGIVGMLAAKICNVRLKIHTVAGLPLMETTGFKYRLLVAVEQIAYKCADWVLPNSVVQMEFIKNNISTDDKITMIGRGSSNGINLDYFKKGENYNSERVALRVKYDISEDDIVLVFVGRLANYKGINELVDCFKILAKKYAKLKLLLVGPFEDINPLSKDTIHEIETNERILSTGYQSDVRPFFVLADIFVFPSYREGFPQAVMQACAYELPCVVTDINGCNELVFEGINGYLVPPKNVKSLINACELLITNPDKRASLGNHGRKYLLENFEQKSLWENVYKFYLTNLN